MNVAQFLRDVAESTADLTDTEREVTAGEIRKFVAGHMRVRELKGNAPTLPPPDDRAVPIDEAKRAIARGEPLPMRVSFEGLPESLTRCELPTLNGEEER